MSDICKLYFRQKSKYNKENDSKGLKIKINYRLDYNILDKLFLNVFERAVYSPRNLKKWHIFSYLFSIMHCIKIRATKWSSQSHSLPRVRKYKYHINKVKQWIHPVRKKIDQLNLITMKQIHQHIMWLSVDNAVVYID